MTERILLSLSRRGLRRSDLFVASSESTKRDLMDHAGISPSRIHVVHLGVDHTLFGPARCHQSRDTLNHREWPGPYILHVGSLHPRKNIETLVRGLARAQRLIPELRLVLAGAQRSTDERQRQIEEHISRAGVRGSVTITGALTDSEIATLYQSAEAFVMPSHYEGFGLPALEAMASGCPVIVSNASSLPEIVGNAGILVDPNDSHELASAIVRVCTSKAVQNGLRAAGLAQAARFTWQRTAEETITVYERSAEMIRCDTKHA